MVPVAWVRGVLENGYSGQSRDRRSMGKFVELILKF
jgi:hypothetical protein